MIFIFQCYHLSFLAIAGQDRPPIIFGLSILFDNSLSPTAASLTEGLSILLKSGLLSSHVVANGSPTIVTNRKIEGVQITFQQAKCLKFATQGMTAKKIANKLGISFRTVERHFENLRHKLKVKSKAELIEKVISHQSKIG